MDQTSESGLTGKEFERKKERKKRKKKCLVKKCQRSPMVLGTDWIAFCATNPKCFKTDPETNASAYSISARSAKATKCFWEEEVCFQIKKQTFYRIRKEEEFQHLPCSERRNSTEETRKTFRSKDPSNNMLNLSLK